MYFNTLLFGYLGHAVGCNNLSIYGLTKLTWHNKWQPVVHIIIDLQFWDNNRKKCPLANVNSCDSVTRYCLKIAVGNHCKSAVDLQCPYLLFLSFSRRPFALSVSLLIFTDTLICWCLWKPVKPVKCNDQTDRCFLFQILSRSQTIENRWPAHWE